MEAFDAWVEEARAVPLEAYARSLSPTLKRSGRDMIGPCPACGGRDRFSIALTKGVFFCRQWEGGRGGDVIALARHVTGGDFLVACEALTGRPAPGRSASETAEDRTAREQRLVARRHAEARRAADRARRMGRDRESERVRADRIWRAAEPIAGTSAEAYLARRGLVAPAHTHLRFACERGYYAAREIGGVWRPVCLHRGPALVAGVRGTDGRLAAVHLTWIDLADADGKLRLLDPDTGELMPAKKVRGTVHGARIELVRHPAPTRLFLGEGIETCLSAYQALARTGSALVEGAAVWSSVSLGNLAGRALDRLRHPTLRDPDTQGRLKVRLVPGVEPDPVDAAIPIPASVTSLILLGDGDSDRFTTEMALRRAANRLRRPGLEIAIAWAAPGSDFNKMLREAA